MLEEQFEELQKAVRALYNAGHWTCDRDVDEKSLWENVRDAAFIEAGSSPQNIRKD